MRRIHLNRLSATLVALACALASSVGWGQSFSPGLKLVFREAHDQKNDLARYVYLGRKIPMAQPDELPFLYQLYAFTENELGLYNEALRDFPIRSAPIKNLVLPNPENWTAVNAASAIAASVGDRRLVMINEAHHDAHTRELTLQLLPKLRAKGFKYFAAEALGNDEGLAKRGYPVWSTGSEYLHEPLYGEIIREALRLGFTVVPYDSDSPGVQDRERNQANNLFNRTFKVDPAAKVFVHGGFAHIDRAPGRLGKIQPMGMLLGKLIGQLPLSIDQTQFREQFPNVDPAYVALTQSFKPSGPTVLIEKGSANLWSAAPDLYNVSVILPPERRPSLASGAVHSEVIVSDTNRAFPMVAHIVNTQRPDWIQLGGARKPVRISSLLCKAVVPCVIEARYEKEAADAIPADRYAFVHPNSAGALFLSPGRYRISARDADGKAISERTIEVQH
ncbi:MAG: hypothetical protein AB1832_15720 [Pseudomonadota bacterium]